jgi:hypothetical protein
MEVPHAFGLSSRRPGPGELILVLYGGPRQVEFLATSFALGAGSFVCPSIHEVFGPSLSYFLSHAIKAPRAWGIAFWAFGTGRLCGTPRGLLHIYEQGPIGGIGNTAPSSSDVIPMGSKRFALQGIEYAFAVHSR